MSDETTVLIRITKETEEGRRCHAERIIMLDVEKQKYEKMDRSESYIISDIYQELRRRARKLHQRHKGIPTQTNHTCMSTIITKELHAVFLDGKQITRYRNDKIRTIAIAKKTNWNVNQVNNPFANQRAHNVGVLSRKVQKKTDDTRSFAMIANEASPNIYDK